MHDSFCMDVKQSIQHSCHDVCGHAFRDGLSGDLLEQLTALAKFQYQHVAVFVVIHLKQTRDARMV